VGRETVIAARVSCYDLTPDGALLFATGARIFATPGRGGALRELARDELNSGLTAPD
jgi:hypothetical protein